MKHVKKVEKRKKDEKEIDYQIPLKNRETGKRIVVDVFKPEDDDDPSDHDALDPRPSMLEAATACWEKIKNHNKAEESTKFLRDAGCDCVQILAHIEQYCEYPRSIYRKELVEGLQAIRDKIATFQSRVTKWQSEMKDMNSFIEEWLHVNVAAHAPQFDVYQAVLEVARTGAFPFVKLPHIKKESLVYVCHLVRTSTGENHNEELAYILQGRMPTKDPVQLIKSTYYRFKVDNPERFNELKAAAHIRMQWQDLPERRFPFDNS